MHLYSFKTFHLLIKVKFHCISIFWLQIYISFCSLHKFGLMVLERFVLYIFSMHALNEVRVEGVGTQTTLPFPRPLFLT